MNMKAIIQIRSQLGVNIPLYISFERITQLISVPRGCFELLENPARFGEWRCVLCGFYSRVSVRWQWKFRLYGRKLAPRIRERDGVKAGDSTGWIEGVFSTEYSPNKSPKWILKPTSKVTDVKSGRSVCFFVT